jgi:hypothetical protein
LNTIKHIFFYSVIGVRLFLQHWVCMCDNRFWTAIYRHQGQWSM